MNFGNRGNFAFVPRAWSGLLALICVGAVLAFGIARETPTGRVEGRVVLADGRPLAHAKITLTSDDGSERVRRLRATSDEDGQWQVPRAPAGLYHVAAVSRAHASEETSVWVSEDETAPVALRLKRTQPDLKAAQQQSAWTPSETAILPLQGYTDAGRDGQGEPLRMRIFRTRFADVLGDKKAAEALGQVANRYQPLYAIPAALLSPAKAAAPVLVAHRVLPVTGADIEGFFHQRVALGRLQPGLYLIEVAHGPNRVCAQLTVSDMALVVKKARGTLLAYAVDSGSGAPRARADIRLWKSGQLVGQTRTDAQGLARIALPQADDDGRLMTLASLGQNEATVGQYDYSEGDENNGKFTVAAYTDRPIYRPGGRVFYKAIARQTLDQGLKYAVRNGQNVDVEVRDPSGTRIEKTSLKANDYGSFHGAVTLSPEAPTGSYSLVMTLDGEEHTADFEVASYRKPEFSATVSPNQTHYSEGDNVEMMVAANYYFGAPVAGARVRYDVFRAPDWASLYGDSSDQEDADDQYYGGDEGQYYADESGESVAQGELKLDANGHAVVQFTAQKPGEIKGEEWMYDKPQGQIYTVSVTVEDAANRTVDAQGEVPVSAGDFRLLLDTAGSFAVPGQATTVVVEAKNFQGKPLANQPVELLTSYRSDDGKTTLSPRRYRATTNAAGATRLQIVPSREGVLTLSATSTDARDRQIEATRSLWVASESGGDYDAPYADLSVLTDKKHYKSGEAARVLINAARAGGTALVTIEGSKLFRAWTVPLPRKSNVLRVPLPEDYGPNVTLAACLVRDKKFARSEAALRVSVPRREVRVAVRSARAKYQPGQRASYEIQTSNAQGQPIAAEVSLGVVDEAIYALQEDDKGALKRAFYPRNPNNVQTSYSFEPLYLGDVNKASPVIDARSKFLDTAFWRPDVMTDQSGRAHVEFDLPDNLTTWRATAIAQTKDSAFGRAQSEVVVAKDFFVRLETPRFLTGGDAGQIAALVHNETGQTQNATVKMEADGLDLGGDATQTLSLAPGQVGKVVWPVATDANGLGYQSRARLKLSAWSGDRRFTDAVETALPVRPRGREQVANFVGQVGPRGVSQKLSLDASAIPASSRVAVRITPSVSAALVGALPYLTGFPYGCTEQTMSRFLPDILVQRALRLNGANDAQLSKELPVMVRDGLTRLRRFQHNSGGWGWWENDADDAWMTAYVLYGLAQARAEGYAVNDEVLANGRRAALDLLATAPTRNWQRRNWENTRAFALYAVSIAAPTAPERAKVRRLRLQTPTQTLDAQALGYLVLLDAELGLASQSWDQLEGKLRREGEQMLHWQGSGREAWADWDDVTATALGLQAMLKHNPNDPNVTAVVLWLMTHRRDDAWGNTRDTAWSLGALCDYLGAQPPERGSASPPTLKIALNGRELQTLNLKNADGEVALDIPWKELRASGNRVEITREGGGAPVFYALSVRQTLGSAGPLPALVSVPVSGGKISIAREYRRVTTSGGAVGSVPTGNKLSQGDQIRVRLTLEVPTDLSYVLIEDAFPAGCETTERGDAGVDEWDNWWSSTDVRDDRIAFFARHLTRGKHTIEYNLRAQTPGDYRVLPALLQAMYDTDTRAETAEDRLQIR